MSCAKSPPNARCFNCSPIVAQRCANAASTRWLVIVRSQCR
jgi:hypothetical protein